MMETSTPRRNNLRRRSLLNISTVNQSPAIRKSILGPSVNASPIYEPADEEEERLKRRKAVALQKRLSNISSATSASPLIDVNPLTEESQIQDHLRICAKLYTENRISAKNAWQLHVIDVIRKLAFTNSDNVLQVAGSSLDIGAKVYGLRVDDVHSKGLQLASSMAKQSDRPNEEEAVQDINEELNPREKRNARRKNKKLATDKRNTIDYDEKTLFAPIKTVESVVFSTKESLDISAIDNLFTHKLPVNPATHRIMLLSNEKFWTRNPDNVLVNADKIFDIKLPEIKNYSMCLPFKDFETGTWDLDEEERLLANAHSFSGAVLDSNGLPIPELDGSIHDIFEDNDIPEDPSSDVEEQPLEVFQAQLNGEVAHIVDAIPEAHRTETEYGYNPLIKTLTGKYIDKIWAGPSHWKVKFNRRSTARFSGTTVQQVVRQTRKHTKDPTKIDFTQDDSALCLDVGQFIPKRAPPTASFAKVTLPMQEICLIHFEKQRREWLLKPGVRRSNNNKVPQEPRDYEVQVYNYENPNDSLYCSQNNNDDGHDDGPDNEPMHNSFEKEMPPVPQEHFSDENLVNAPEMVSATQIPYAMQAKKMDMKKLKSAVWKCLTTTEDKNRITVKELTFSSLLHNLPALLPADMRKELSCPLSLVALLHLCNENNLELKQTPDYKDFVISVAVE